MPEDTITSADTVAAALDANNWRTLLPEDMREDSSLKPFKTVGDIAKSYKELASKLGKEHVVKPNANSSKEAWEKYYTDLGRPESPDKYEFTLPTEDDRKVADDEVKALREMAYSLALDPERAQKLVNTHIERRDAANKAATDKAAAETENQKAAFEAELRQKFGTQNLENLLAAANIAAEKYGGQELMDFLNKTGLKNNPAIVGAFIKVAQETGERVLSDKAKDTTLMTKEDALRKRNQMLADKNGAYYNKNSASHKDAVQEFVNLTAIIAS